MDFLKRTWAEIDIGHLRHNYFAIRNKLRSDCLFMAVVKANAYGHGDRQVATALEQLGVDYFGVSNFDEAISLRQGGIQKPILILGYTPPELASKLVEYSITQTIYSLDYAEKLAEYGSRLNGIVKVHIKIDTGMGRIGFSAKDCLESISSINKLSALDCEGIFTHFAVADQPDESSTDYTNKQFHCFMEILHQLENLGIYFKVRHCSNSAATLCNPSMYLDMVRVGISMYGISPSSSLSHAIDVKPLMQIFSSISMVKWVSDGSDISYGRTFRSVGSRKIATVPIGYADGYQRCFSNKAHMIVNGQYAPVVGNVCMDQLMLDVTHIEDVNAGDTVTVVGSQRGCSVTFEDLAEIAGTIGYELVCLITKRVPRIYTPS